MADLMPEAERRNGTVRTRREPEAIYDYHDENGTLLYQVVRMPDKGFWQRRPDGTKNLEGVRRVLYRLPEVLETAGRGDTVYICEGEKDVDNLHQLGLVATTNPGGAGKWRDDYSDALRGAHVVILPDNDEPGRKHAEVVAKSVSAKARTVKIVELPGLPKAGDVTDWLKAGGTRDKLLLLVAKTPAKYGRTPNLVRLDGVEPEEPEFLWYPYVPKGKVTNLFGPPGLGKTHMALAFAAIVSRGHPFPDSVDGVPRGASEPGTVLILSAEDGIADTLVPRLLKAGADMQRVFVLTGSVENPDAGVTLQTDLDLLHAAATQVRPSLIIIDPIQAYIGGVDMNQATDVRPVYKVLARLAEQHNSAVLVIGHLRKGGAERAIYRALGSIDFVAAARSMLLLDDDPNDEGARILAHAKSNLAPLGSSLRFRLIDGHIEWLGVSNLTAEDLNGPSERSSEERGNREEAIDWLRDALQDGPQFSHDLIKRAKDELGVSERTLKRAKAALGVVHFKEPGRDGRWMWELPGEDKQDNHATDTVGTLGTHTSNTLQDGVSGKYAKYANHSIGALGAHGSESAATLEEDDDSPW